MKRMIDTVDIRGNLLWSRNGTVSAAWRLTPMRYPGDIKGRETVKNMHRLLARSIHGEFMLLSVVLRETAETVVGKMIHDMNLEELPGLIAEAEATLDAFEGVEFGTRAFWLIRPLANKARSKMQAPVRSAFHQIKQTLDFPTDRLSDSDYETRHKQMVALESAIPAVFRPRRVGAAETYWIFNHAMHRGQPVMPIPSSDNLTEAAQSAAVLPEPMFDEGAREGTPASARASVRDQRFLKVMDLASPDRDQGSYQAFMGISQTPPGGWRFPGSEFFQALDRSGVDVDWAIIGRVNNRQEVLDEIRKMNKMLTDQVDQRSSEVEAGMAFDIGVAKQMLTSYAELMQTDTQEVEVSYSILLAVAAPEFPGITEEQAIENVELQATTLQSWLNSEMDVKAERIPGTATTLWSQMLPGQARDRLLSRFEQRTTSDMFAMLVPMTGIKVGTETGSAFGLSQETARPSIVYTDIGGFPEKNISGSVCFVGDMGAGKSFAMKTQCSFVVDRGGQWSAIDASPEGEWARFAQAFESNLVIGIRDPQWSMDVLRIFHDRPEGAEFLAGFLTQLARLDASGNDGVTLARVLEPSYRAEHDIDSSAALVDHLLSANDPMKTALGQKLDVWRQNPISQVVFDPNLPVPDMGVEALVWRTAGLEQPRPHELEHAHEYAQMGPAKIMGKAYYWLLNRVATYLGLLDQARPYAFVVDELEHIVANIANVDPLVTFLRRGRRGKGLLIAGTQRILDIADPTLRGLFGIQVVMRTSKPEPAADAVRWLGIERDDPQFEGMLKRITTDMSPVIDNEVPVDRRGEAYVLDPFGGLAFIKLLGPNNPLRASAVGTTPPKSLARL